MFTSSWPNFEVGGGSFNSASKILRELEKNSVNIDAMTRDILQDSNYTACDNKRRLNLVTTTPRNFGFAGTVYQSIFFNAVERSGLRLIPADTALLLRLRYRKQSESRILYAGMETISFKGKSYIFVLTASKSSVWVRVEVSGYDSLWPDNAEFLFQS